MPPVPAQCWGQSTTLNATAPGPACPQLDLKSSLSQSEDCLFLNVFSTLPAKPVPVMVWVYGGSSTDGSTETYGAIQNLVSLLNGEIVLVAFNYRLNSFGYFALKELSAADPRHVSGNYGVLDCQLALHWVQQHIASFGGDPRRVTVFGQSSGGTQILGLLASPGSRGLFASAISLSGSPNITMSLDVMEQQGLQFVEAAGCANSSDVLSCMYALDTQQLRIATPQHWSYEGNFAADTVTPHPALYPGLVIADGVTVTPLPSALRAGVMDVPVIIATVQCEDGEPDNVVNWSRADFNQFCSKQFSTWPAPVAPGMQSLYADLADKDAGYAYSKMESDVNMACGSAAITVTAGQGFSAPVYLAMNTHWPSHAIYDSPSHSGTPRRFPYHTWDTSCAFETWGGYDSTGQPWKPEVSDVAYGEHLRQLWLALARDGRLPSQFKTVNDIAGFPKSYNTLLLSNTVTSVANYNTELCATLESYGFDQKFWWVN